VTAPAGKISLWTATSIAVANMIGTGVFTSLGFQLAGIKSGFALLGLWALGGLFALCGALVYGELGATLPRSGGEFNFLGRIYHPVFGFLAGWISFVMGFALPIALAAMAFGGYLHRVWPAAPPVAASCLLVALVALLHLYDLRLGSLVQNLSTSFKVGLILVFIGAAAWRAFLADGGAATAGEAMTFAPGAADLQAIFSRDFGVSLLFVMYAYSGWNASTYLIDEIAEPARNVPLSLVLATGTVALLYVGLNWAFLAAAPAAELEGQLEVGHVAARHVFGEDGGRLMSALLCIALVSTISAMTWAGPRVTQAIGQDHSFFRALARTSPRGIPVYAILAQTGLVLLLLLTASFESLLVYTQFTLALCSALAVAGIFVLRHGRQRRRGLPRPFSAWGYPVTPAIFLVLSVVMVLFTLKSHPGESLAGFATVILGLPIYWLSPGRPSAPEAPA
jgi:basic amino acid/polyamine antiporter, APA family